MFRHSLTRRWAERASTGARTTGIVSEGFAYSPHDATEAHRRLLSSIAALRRSHRPGGLIAAHGGTNGFSSEQRMPRPPTPAPLEGSETFIGELKPRIRSAQVRSALSVNRELVLLYWSIGRDILERQ